MEAQVNIHISNNIAYLIIERPQALNAINKQVMKELHTFFTTNAGNKELHGVIITGSGEKAFAAGADIKEFEGLTVEEGQAMSKFGHDTYFLIENFHVPVIAAVNGFALGGGCELAMACHMRVASDNARFGQPEVKLGLLPGYGGTQRLVQLIGKGKAMELLLTADMIGAQEAHRLGLVNHVTQPNDLIPKCVEIINKIATQGPTAVQLTIATVNAYFDNLAAFELEVTRFGEAMASPEAKEGADAFVNKRPADFRKFY